MFTGYPDWCLPLLDNKKNQKIKDYAGWLSKDGIKKGLISNKSKEYIWEEFIIHSLGFGKIVIEEKKKDTVCDLGTGAGIPGILIALTNPSTEVFLIDRSKKRIFELERIKKTLEINNIHPTLVSAEFFVSRNLNKVDIFVARCFMPSKKIVENIFKNKKYPEEKKLIVSSKKKRAEDKTFHVKHREILLNNGERRNIDVITLK